MSKYIEMINKTNQTLTGKVERLEKENEALKNTIAELKKENYKLKEDNRVLQSQKCKNHYFCRTFMGIYDGSGFSKLLEDIGE
jgi:predicted RNase H-like nuclease (RuvC/YqgF family)